MAETIITLRRERGWSQAELARRLGVAQSTVCRIENGQPPTGPVRILLESLLAEKKAA